MSRKLETRARDVCAGSGVGAIVEIGRQSFVTAELAFWGGGRYEGEVVDHPRLARRLGVEKLRSGIGVGEHGRLGPAFVRFPSWVVCERCGRMRQLVPVEYGPRQPECDECGRGSALLGVRWVAACPDGHLFDVPWWKWAHVNSLKHEVKDPVCRGRRGLRLKSQRRRGVGDGGMVVECRDCGAASSLFGLVGSGTLAQVGMKTCPGTQPWLSAADARSCGETPWVLMRASSRLHFPKATSMLDIPPDADRRGDGELAHRISQAVPDIQKSLWLARRKRGESISEELGAYAADLGASIGDLEEYLDRDSEEPWSATKPGGSVDLGEDADSEFASRMEEWRALVTPRPDAPPWTRFRTEHLDVDALGAALAHLFRRVVLVHRLREVRAYYGYRRLYNDGERSRLVRPAREAATGRLASPWLPAHEVSGEGVFLEVSPSAVDAWLALQGDPETLASRAAVRKRFADSYLSVSPTGPIMADVSFVLLHTLSHLVIREMAFSAGYTAASIRERIYTGTVGSDRARGILLYTAEGDSEGTLGGLVRLGETRRLRPILASLLERARWCGQDPVCRESRGQGTSALNLAACHGCSLVPETSCDHGNVLLDRNVLVSSRPAAPGYFDWLGHG